MLLSVHFGKAFFKGPHLRSQIEKENVGINDFHEVPFVQVTVPFALREWRPFSFRATLRRQFPPRNRISS